MNMPHAKIKISIIDLILYMMCKRNIRATRDLTGCTCKALKVDKLSVIKMKTELSAHGHLGEIYMYYSYTYSKYNAD
jgi:hypothetical protein